MEIQDLLKRPDLLSELGIDIKSRKLHWGKKLDFLKMKLYVKAADMLEMDADYRTIMPYAAVDASAMRYCTQALDHKVNELLKELPNG